MAITNGYCTVDELIEQNRSAASVSPQMLERAITACSRGIDRFCERTFFQITEARVFDARWSSDGRQQVVPFGPYSDLSAAPTLVKTDDNRNGTYSTTWAAGDYQLYPMNPNAGPQPRPYEELRCAGTRTFPEVTGQRAGLVQVTGVWGWPQIPADINQACVLHAARIFKRKDSPEGVSGWNEFGAIRVGRTDPDVVAFLEPFQYFGGIGSA